MKKLLVGGIVILTITACGTLKISETDKALVAKGEKSLLITTNREPLLYFTLLPLVFDKIFGKPIEVNIEEVDGKKVTALFRANKRVAVEPGMREVIATCTFENFFNDNLKESHTQSVDYFFEGGKRYRVNAETYFEHCKIIIEPY